jgi:chemotaxis protein histidine kinase CheA
MTLAASVRAHSASPEKRFDALRGGFLGRVDSDLAALARHWSALEEDTSTLASLAAIRRIAHDLAGAGGIFGFDGISNAAAALEEAVILEGEGSGTVSKIGAALDRVLSCVETDGRLRKTA